MSFFEVWVSPVLMQNPDIWNFHRSLTLNIRMYTQKKNYILQLKVSRFHDHQAILDE